MKPTSRKLDEEAVRAAEEFLLGRARDPQSAEPHEAAAEAPAYPENAQGFEPPRLELSAPDIRRAAAGWRARCIHTRGVDSRHVKDALYGGYIGSFIAALDARDRFFRDRGLPIPSEIEAIVDGVRVAPEITRTDQSIVVRWQGEDHEVTGDDAEEIATEIALDLFVEYIDTMRPRANDG